MECDTFMIICFYCIFLVSIIIELVFLFQVPYYYYSNYLKCLKVIRIIINIINLLIDIYFLIIQYAEKLIKKEEKEENEERPNDSSSRKYQLFEKILIIIAFSLSSVTFILNIIGIGLTAKYLKTFDSSFIQNSLYIDTLLFLIENTLVSLCWLYFLIFWGFNIKDFIKDDKKKPKVQIDKKEKENENRGGVIKDNNGNDPAPLQQEISSGRDINK